MFITNMQTTSSFFNDGFKDPGYVFLTAVSHGYKLGTLIFNQSWLLMIEAYAFFLNMLNLITKKNQRLIQKHNLLVTSTYVGCLAMQVSMETSMVY